VETVARLIAFCVGILLVVTTAWSVFSTLVVPRATPSRLLGGLARSIGRIARMVAPHLPSYERRDRLFSFVGPAAMVAMFALWLATLVFGFALMMWWDTGRDFADSLGIAGSSATTLGILTTKGTGAHILEITVAAIGLLVVALEIAYLPALYGAFATREAQVTLLAARAGTPVWGPEILARHHFLDIMDELPDLYADWERWAAAVAESHANYPALIWFRSPVGTRSWLVALVGMMDSAALFHATSPAQTPREARLCLSMGITCLRSMARALRIPYDADPLPTAAIRLTREEFDEGFLRLGERGFPAERDADESWRHFQGWRINYEPIVDALTELIMPPPAPWFEARPELGDAEWPSVTNRTPDNPGGSQPFGSTMTFKTPPERESKSS
jgi:hypothetical protein